MRRFRSFSFKEAHFRIASPCFDLITAEIRSQRLILEHYIEAHPGFARALAPIRLDAREAVPESVRRMVRAADLVGVGPMAAVAGTMAQLAAEAAFAAGADEAIVENGGDIFFSSADTVVAGLYPGSGPLQNKLALQIDPGQMPVALCSSSSRMGHSLSLGDCDLATVLSPEAALADAAATMACNLVQTAEDLQEVLERIGNIEGISAVLLIRDESIGIWGDLPRLIRHTDPEFKDKISRNPNLEIE